MRYGSPLHSDTHDAHIVPEPKSSPTGLTILESISFERHSGLKLAHVRSAAEDISGAGAGVVARPHSARAFPVFFALDSSLDFHHC